MKGPESLSSWSGGTRRLLWCKKSRGGIREELKVGRFSADVKSPSCTQQHLTTSWRRADTENTLMFGRLFCTNRTSL